MDQNPAALLGEKDGDCAPDARPGACDHSRLIFKPQRSSPRLLKISTVIRGLHHVSRTVADIDKSIHFYGSLLGLPVALDEELQGKELELVVGLENARLRIVEFTLGDGQFVEVLQYYSPPGRPILHEPTPADVGASHIALVVDDIHSMHTRLKRAGVRFTSIPTRITAGFFKGAWTTYCFDPDGLVIELWQPVPG